MKKILFLLLANLVLLNTIKAQDEDEDEKKGFKKETSSPAVVYHLLFTAIHF